MSSPDYVWIYPPSYPELLHSFVREFNIPALMAQILISRGLRTIEEVHDFLYAKLPNLHDPSLFLDMDKATKRVSDALRKKESILIYGDNDVDGITATALLVEFLRELGGDIHYYLTNRVSQKKDIIADALDFATKKNCKLLITVDCGITAAKGISEVIEHGIDVIVTDHHEPTSKIPNCIATLNPKLLTSTYPNRDLTGVGVAFKLAHAITNCLVAADEITPDKIDLKKYLDLVALGTIGDMGALTGENRILVRYGLKQMKKLRRTGLLKLFTISDLSPFNLAPINIASKIAPRINSLGRIADPLKGVELLLIKDPIDAERLAKELDLNNLERQRIERKTADNIEAMLLKTPALLTHRAIGLYSNEWHSGVIAILAARIVKQYNRPTVLISVENGIGKGSLRTIPEFPLLSFLKEQEHILINFGGHDFAAGLTIQEENIPMFIQKFQEKADQQLQEQDVVSKIYLDVEVNFSDLTFDLMESLQLLEPFGHENPAPLLYTDAKQVWPPKIIGQLHLKFFLEQEERALEGVGFTLAHKKEQFCKKNVPVRVAFTPQLNTFLNKTSIQLLVKDLFLRELKLPENANSNTLPDTT